MRVFAPVFAVAILAAVQAQARPVVVEMFTSQACSSCPPADALLQDLKAHDPDILPLSFDVTYWNGPAWTDSDSLTAATDRQSWYVGLRNSDTVYTPEVVVDGGAQLVGSDRGELQGAITKAKAAQGPSVPVSVTSSTAAGNSGARMIIIIIGNAKIARPETLWLFGFDSTHTTQIGGGENAGATLSEVNVVRSITSLGTWTGTSSTYGITRPAGQHMAVILQRPDGVINGAGAD